jgi:hypothetical protein
VLRGGGFLKNSFQTSSMRRSRRGSVTCAFTPGRASCRRLRGVLQVVEDVTGLLLDRARVTRKRRIDLAARPGQSNAIWPAASTRSPARNPRYSWRAAWDCSGDRCPLSPGREGGRRMISTRCRDQEGQCRWSCAPAAP